MSHLLLFSLGPVQDFIATARRCQDLWFGSWLLSDLSRASAMAIREALGGHPALVVPGSLTAGAAANEIYAIAATASAAQVAADAAREAISRRLDAHIQWFDRLPTVGFLRSTAEAQVRDLIETAWVALAFDAAEYGVARARAKALLAARKASKCFTPVPWIQPGAVGLPKSSLDGARESVIEESVYEAVKSGHSTAEWLRKHFRARPAERLSGVDLLKRLGQEVTDGGTDDGRPSFHSSSHIAAGPLRTRLARLDPDGTRLQAYLDALTDAGVDLGASRVRCGEWAASRLSTPEGTASIVVPRALAESHGTGLDGHLFYEGRLRDILEQYSTVQGDQRRSSAAEMLGSGLRQFLTGVGWKRPVQPYYAYLLADGDRMGACIGALVSPEEHRRFSECLETWASECRGIVEQHLGSCIYAGGDDVMALLPLHTALACSRALTESFLDAMVGALCLISPDRRPAAPTLSVGLALVHHLEPMRDALAQVRRAEKAAKRERNSLAIRLSKRSGGDLEASAPWDAPLGDLGQRLDGWCRHFSGEVLPDKAAFALDAAVQLVVDAPDGSIVSADVVSALARRALGRRRGGGGSEALPDCLAEQITRRFRQAANPRAAVEALSAELQIARLFLDAYQEAWGDDVFQGGNP